MTEGSPLLAQTLRIGQDRPVFVYRLIAADTVEDKIADLQRRKSALADRVLAGDAPDTLLDDDELTALFSPVSAPTAVA